MVDMWRQTLCDSATHLRVYGLLSDLSPAYPSLFHVQQDSSDPFLSLLSEFPALTQVCTAEHPIKHNIHHIETTGPPVSARTRRLTPEHLRNAREEFEYMLELALRPVVGRPPYIWFPNVFWAIGGLMEISVP